MPANAGLAGLVRDVKVIVKVVVWIAIVAAAVVFVFDPEWRYTFRTGVKSYGAPARVVERRPHDCEFFTAPIGRKHCHYEAVYETEWIKLADSIDNSSQPVVYGDLSAAPPDVIGGSCLPAGCIPTELISGEAAPDHWWRKRSIGLR
jgi:hypothetical protein